MTSNTATVSCTFVPVTDVKVGDFISAGDVTAIRDTAKTRHFTVRTARGEGTYSQAKASNIARYSASTVGPEQVPHPDSLPVGTAVTITRSNGGLTFKAVTTDLAYPTAGDRYAYGFRTTEGGHGLAYFEDVAPTPVPFAGYCPEPCHGVGVMHPEHDAAKALA